MGSALGHKDALLFMSLPPSELTLQHKEPRVAVPQCSIVPDNMDRFTLRHGSLVRKGWLWHAERATRPVRQKLQRRLWNRINCQGFEISIKIQRAKSARSHCTLYLLGENPALPLTPKWSSQSSATTYQQLENHLLNTSLSLPTYLPFPLEVPAFVCLTYQSLFIWEREWGWRGNSYLLLSY